MDESRTFDAGDTVRLKIGGPLMTVLSVAGDECCCIWFGEGARLEHGSFECEVVEFVERGRRLVPQDTFWSRQRPSDRPGTSRAA
jgi:uncharacterized protein YodC (DUF2158 family)